MAKTKGGGGGECVKVCVRCRPFNSKEKSDNRKLVVGIDNSLLQVSVDRAGEPPKSFTFDAVFDMESTQEQVYEETAYPLVESVLEGFNGTIFAYGQTGCGKTHSMEGKPEPPELRGIIPRAFSQIFDTIKATEHIQFLVRASFIEIYNEEIRDLLGPDPKRKLELKENPEKGVFIKDLTNVVVNSEAETSKVMAMGSKNRTVGATLMNADSSRSHSLFTIYIEMAEDDPNKKDGKRMKAGKLNLVDLAGSERQGKTGATGERLKEATKINLSLSALGNVISALVDGKTAHIPYRDSKLTRLLQDSLGGNTKTVMLAAVGPADYNYDETISTLRYANRAKNIKNKPKINEDPKDTLLRQYQEEIHALKAALEAAAAGGGGTPLPAAVAASPNQSAQPVQVTQVVADNGELQEVTQEMQAKLEKEQQERSALQAKLKEMEAKLLSGAEGEEHDAAVKEAELKKAEAKLRKQKKKEAELQAAQKQAEEERELIEEQYGSLQEECDALKRVVKKLKVRLRNTKAEVDDIQMEFGSERTELLEVITAIDRQKVLYEQICIQLLGHKRLDRIEEQAQWDDSSETWILPQLKLPSATNGTGHSGGGLSPHNPGSHRSSEAVFSPREAAPLPPIGRNGGGGGNGNKSPKPGGVGFKELLSPVNNPSLTQEALPALSPSGQQGGGRRSEKAERAKSRRGNRPKTRGNASSSLDDGTAMRSDLPGMKQVDTFDSLWAPVDDGGGPAANGAFIPPPPDFADD